MTTKHLQEQFLFDMLREGSVVGAVKDTCRQYALKYGRQPNLVFVSHKLQAAFEDELDRAMGNVHLTVPSQDIRWFYCAPGHEAYFADALYIIVAHTHYIGYSCTL